MPHPDNHVFRRYGTYTLLGLHLCFFLVLRFMALPKELSILFVLRNDSLYPPAILLHSFGLTNLFACGLLLLLFGLLGTRVESRCGSAALFVSYFLGTLFGGICFFLFASLSPEHCELGLTMPAGVLCAWSWLIRRARGEAGTAAVDLNRPITLDWLARYGALALCVVVFAYYGPPATGWILAASAGILAAPVARWMLSRSRQSA